MTSRRVKTLAQFLLVFFLFMSVASSAEEQPEVLLDWDEIQRVAVDITDKVKVLPGDILKTETYRIGVDEIPELPNPHPICKAEEGWDSFPDGAESPVKDFPARYPYDWGGKCTPSNNNFLQKFLENRQWKGILAHNVMVFSPFKRIESVYLRETRQNEDNSAPFRILDNDYFISFERHSGGKYPFSDIGLRPIRKAAICKYEDNEIVLRKSLPELDEYSFEGWITNVDSSGQLSKKWYVLMKRGEDSNHIACIDKSGIVAINKTQFPEYGIDWGGVQCWMNTYPSFLFHDRNFGHWKGGKRNNYDPLDPYRSESVLVNPDKKFSELVTINIETGMITSRIDGMTNGLQLTPAKVLVSNIVKNKRLGNAIFIDGKYSAFLPYCTYNASEMYLHEVPWVYPTENVISSDTLYVVDYSDMTLRKTQLNYRIDNSSIGTCRDGLTCIFTSKRTENAEMVYDFCISYYDEHGERKIHSVVSVNEDIIVPLIATDSYALFDGQYLYIVHLRQAWKVMVEQEPEPAGKVE